MMLWLEVRLHWTQRYAFYFKNEFRLFGLHSALIQELISLLLPNSLYYNFRGVSRSSKSVKFLVKLYFSMRLYVLMKTKQNETKKKKTPKPSDNLKLVIHI